MSCPVGASLSGALRSGLLINAHFARHCDCHRIASRRLPSIQSISVFGLCVVFWLTQPERGWKGGIGFVTAEMMAKNLYPPADVSVLVFVCSLPLCGPADVSNALLSSVAPPSTLLSALLLSLRCHCLRVPACVCALSWLGYFVWALRRAPLTSCCRCFAATQDVLLLFCGPAPMIGFLEKNAKGPHCSGLVHRGPAAPSCPRCETFFACSVC